MTDIKINVSGFLSAGTGQAERSGKAGTFAAVFMASAIVWNNRFAPIYGQQVLPRGQLRKTVEAALLARGSKASSVLTYLSDGQRMEKTHGVDIEMVVKEYVNDETRNAAPTMTGVRAAVLAWAEITFPNVDTMKTETNMVLPKTKDEKEAARVMALFTAVNKMKDVSVLRDIARFADLKQNVLDADANISPETRATYHADIHAILLSHKSQDNKDQISEVLANLNEDDNVVVLQAA
jgi:hypothetical protein